MEGDRGTNSYTSEYKGNSQGRFEYVRIRREGSGVGEGEHLADAEDDEIRTHDIVLIEQIMFCETFLGSCADGERP